MSIKQQVADVLAEHWWDDRGCVCGNESEWTLHVADKILKIPRIITEPM
jgi:hypothetical protein